MMDKGNRFWATKPKRFISKKLSINEGYVVLESAEFRYLREQMQSGDHTGEWTCYCQSFSTQSDGSGGFMIPLNQIRTDSRANAKEDIETFIRAHFKKVRAKKVSEEALQNSAGFTSSSYEDDDTFSYEG